VNDCLSQFWVFNLMDELVKGRGARCYIHTCLGIDVDVAFITDSSSDILEPSFSTIN
jgi:hypothetical protein